METRIGLLLAQLLATTKHRFPLLTWFYWSTRKPIPKYSLNPNMRSSCAAGERPHGGNGYTDNHRHTEFYPPKNGGRIGIYNMMRYDTIMGISWNINGGLSWDINEVPFNGIHFDRNGCIIGMYPLVIWHSEWAMASISMLNCHTDVMEKRGYDGIWKMTGIYNRQICGCVNGL